MGERDELLFDSVRSGKSGRCETLTVWRPFRTRRVVGVPRVNGAKLRAVSGGFLTEDAGRAGAE